MKKKLTVLMFGLLLAVGWTSNASAQELAMHKSTASLKSTKKAEIKQSDAKWEMPNALKRGQGYRAPLRSQNFSVTAPVTHTKSWYQNLPNVTWDGGSQNITEPFTTVDGMIALCKRIYTDQTIPGAQYSGTIDVDIPYQTIQRGWNIIGTHYNDDIMIFLGSGYINFDKIRIVAGTDTTVWSVTNNTTSLPSGWTVDGTLRFRSFNVNGQSRRFAYLNGGGYIYIPANQLASSTGYVKVDLTSIFYSGGYTSPNSDNTLQAIGSDSYGFELDSAYSNNVYWSLPFYCPGTVNPPDSCGYTVMLVKLYDGKNYSAPPYEAVERTTTEDELKNYFSEYIEEIQLLTDGLRVNEGSADAGTLFAYTGDLNRFYFISKGKMYYMTSINEVNGDLAPFYSMFEEFSPNTESGFEDITDFYTELRKGTTYSIVHDCQSVNYLQHYFSMSGKQGTAENRVNSLVLYIPDNRGNTERWSRTYVPNHQPTVGMYMIDLFADIEPSATETDTYIATVNWYDNLDDITHVDDIPQTYYLYQIIGNDTICLTPNGTDQTSWTGPYPVGDPTAYDVHYFVIGVPTNATNPDTFFAKSNTDDVTVPGKTDFIGLQWERYESDYVTKNEYDPANNEVNYYRNWLSPHKLSGNNQSGINAGNVGINGRTLTLYREDTPIIDLELVMSGNKAYYRIKYRDRQNNQQVEHGYNENTGEKENN